MGKYWENYEESCKYEVSQDSWGVTSSRDLLSFLSLNLIHPLEVTELEGDPLPGLP